MIRGGLTKLSEKMRERVTEVMMNVSKDQYYWCRDRDMYVSREELLKRFKRSVVVDCRDDDNKGGHIQNAIQLPDSTFNIKSVEIILREIEKKMKNKKDEDDDDSTVDVVFHCMESARRGPRCARRFYEVLKILSLESTSSPDVQIRVLQGGFDQWIRTYFGTDLIEEYDDEYWGFEEIRKMQFHKNYKRPEDQPKTPWSDAGSEVVGKEPKDEV
jgi:rhodanese-related sulfurtransferase